MTCARQGAAQEETPSVGPPPEPTEERRVELRPFAGWAAQDNSTIGGFLGTDVSYRLHPNWAIGGDAALYAPFNGSSGVPLRVPMNETAWSASVDAALFPWAPAARLGAVESYALVGLGVVSTRPVSLVDPSHRQFDYNTRIQFSAGIGLRVFLGPVLSISLELRDMLYFDNPEAPHVAPGSATLPPSDPVSPRNPDTWYATGSSLVDCYQARLGIGWLAP
jgi:hypothetical protein